MSRTPNLVVIDVGATATTYTRYVGRIRTDKFEASEPLGPELVEAMRHDPKQFEEAYQDGDTPGGDDPRPPEPEAA